MVPPPLDKPDKDKGSTMVFDGNYTNQAEAPVVLAIAAEEPPQIKESDVSITDMDISEHMESQDRKSVV